MGADREADVDGVLQDHGGRGGGLELLAGKAGIGEEAVAAPLEADARRGLQRKLDLLGERAGGWAELQRGEAVAMESDVGIGSVGLETLANHQRGLAMRDRALAEEGYVRGQFEIPGNPLPNEVEGVLSSPDIGAAAGNAVFRAGGVELDRAGARREAHVGGGFEEAQVGAGGGQEKNG